MSGRLLAERRGIKPSAIGGGGTPESSIGGGGISPISSIGGGGMSAELHHRRRHIITRRRGHIAATHVITRGRWHIAKIFAAIRRRREV
jgi:hypothetical protein